MSHIYLWIVFGIVVLVMLAVDLGIFQRKVHEVKVKEALLRSALWIGLALLFNVGVYFCYGRETAFQFLAGYLLEESLSVDNLFVFLLIFSYFKVPQIYQHKVLFWGIMGAIVLRAVFIVAGIGLIERFHFLIYVFGAILIFTGIRLATEKDKEIHPDKNPVLRLFKRCMPVTQHYEKDHFFVKQGTQWFATPLFIVLLVVETTDVIFAIDSIPAVLAITRDPFIVYTSNIFAILGLRALFFALSGLMQLFHHLHYGLSAILIFVGVKMFLSETPYHIPIGPALGFILFVLAVSIIASILLPHPMYHK